MKIIKLVIAGILFIIAGYFFYPIMIMILSYTVGGVFTTILNEIAIYSTLMSQAIATSIFLIPGIWFLRKGLKDLGYTNET